MKRYAPNVRVVLSDDPEVPTYGHHRDEYDDGFAAALDDYADWGRFAGRDTAQTGRWRDGWEAGWRAVDQALISRQPDERHGTPEERAALVQRIALDRRRSRHRPNDRYSPYAEHDVGRARYETCVAECGDELRPNRVDQRVAEQFEGRGWREPDVWVDGYAIWYGPEGADGDVATEVESESDGWRVAEYQDVAGYLDEYDEAFPFLKTSTFITTDDLVEHLAEVGITVPEEPPMLAMVRYAAELGVAKLGEYGGEEDFVEELPR